jgi:hypothetical protein
LCVCVCVPGLPLANVWKSVRGESFSWLDILRIRSA